MRRFRDSNAAAGRLPCCWPPPTCARPRPANCRRSCRRPARADHRPARIGDAFLPLAVCRSAGASAADRRHRAGARCRCRGLSLLPAPVCCGVLLVCCRFAAGRHALNRFCVAPDLCRICLVPTCLVLNLLCVEPAFAEPPLCRCLSCGVPQLVPAPRALPDVAKNNCRE